MVFESGPIESTVKIIDFGRSKILKKKEKLTEKAGSVILALNNNSLVILCCSRDCFGKRI